MYQACNTAMHCWRLPGGSIAVSLRAPVRPQFGSILAAFRRTFPSARFDRDRCALCLPAEAGAALAAFARAHSLRVLWRVRPAGGDMADVYAVLHLRTSAPLPLVRAARRVLAQLHYPDAGGDGAAMARINTAADRLEASLAEQAS